MTMTHPQKPVPGGKKSALIVGITGGIGWLMAIVVFAAIREKMQYSNVPKGLRGLGIAFLTCGLMAMAFMGFMGIKFPEKGADEVNSSSENPIVSTTEPGATATELKATTDQAKAEGEAKAAELKSEGETKLEEVKAEADATKTEAQKKLDALKKGGE